MQLKRILVAVKPWQRDLPLAANHARQLAQLADAQLQVVGTVFDAAAAAGNERGEPAARLVRNRALAATQVDLERLARSLRDWGANVVTKAVWGVPAYEGILAAAREWRADLIVLGAHEPGQRHTRLTDTDWQLMRRVECPLLLVKSSSFGGYRTVVAAVDPLHENVESLHRRAVDEIAEQFGIAAAGVDLVAGSAPDAIVETVAKRGADLVVVGMPRRRGVLATVIGSTAELVVPTVACDVLIVPAPVDGIEAAQR